ncbi:MAG: acyl-CoA dehydrogenase family protein [Nocardioides sp.]|uniref:acyl-CoA dehydrogenase family protein n=1 Tax=Nocardioides sp. TaxID=35761 RepID=UPI0039E3EB89
MKRTLYTEDHEAYRETVREFLAREVSPYKDQWDEDRWIPRELFKKAAEAGLYALQIPEEYGGSGVADYRYRLVVGEEVARANAISLTVTLGLQDDLFLAYLLGRADEEQKKRWLPGVASGDLIGALAMTEPGTGSDLQGMRTTAVRDGDHYVVNGQKTFISSGIMADLIVLAVRTTPEGGSNGFSLLMVEADSTPGFERGRKLDKIGLPAQDTAELYFTDARVPVANLLGEEGQGLKYLMSHLPRERLGVSNQSITTARATLDQTIAYLKDRTAFGKRLIDFQATRFALAEMETELDMAQAYVDAQVLAFNDGALTPVDAAKGKWYVSELMKRVVDRCLQLHGGYGFMREYAVGKAYVDTRIQTIYGGTTEIMKEIIGRDIAG